MFELRGLQRLTVGPIGLRMREGECVSVMGPSGSGKSVLLRMLADLDPHEGDAFLDDRACSAMPAPEWRRLVTYVPAEAGWWAETVAEHFAPDADLPVLLPAVGIDPAARQWPVARLSTGERQRLALLRALRPANRVLVLDEPTSGLDPSAVAQVEQLLAKHLAGPGRALLLVTHDRAQAERMARRHFIMQGGRLVAREAVH
ncbi:MAG: ATP-binding cassette domain-containing protein [Ottowia sp.]|uniref:ABC transporter ATP-binding protein n=1 Tax=Ottowia sp. TaxID=1898956 RepID=UPI003C765971